MTGFAPGSRDDPGATRVDLLASRPDLPRIRTPFEPAGRHRPRPAHGAGGRGRQALRPRLPTGKVVLVSFVYTTCTGVCPATTQAIVRIQNTSRTAKLWGKSVAFVSITLDPRRDTPEVLREYARLFHADPAAWHFLTGPPGQVQSVIAAWGMWVKAGPTGADRPSLALFLLDPQGHRREIYSLEFLKPWTSCRTSEGFSVISHR